MLEKECLPLNPKKTPLTPPLSLEMKLLLNNRAKLIQFVQRDSHNDNKNIVHISIKELFQKLMIWPPQCILIGPFLVPFRVDIAYLRCLRLQQELLHFHPL